MKKITDDDTQTADERYRQQWFGQLAPDQQALVLADQQSQFEAIPSYLERYAGQQSEEGGAACR